jgi:uncharacterized membrane protein
MFDRDDLPTRPYPILAPEPTRLDIALPRHMRACRKRTEHDDEVHDTQEDAPRLSSSVLSTSLSVSAAYGYELFCDSERLPEWMAVVRSSRVISRFEDGRAKRTAFIAHLERASMGYTLQYEYDDEATTVSWSTAREASMVITGKARFQPLGDAACMMHYELDMHSDSSLPAWGDPMYNGHPASSVLSDFREFVSRNKH